MTIGDWITALVAVVALGLSIYNTYTQRRDRIPRVEMIVRWNLPRDLPEAVKPAIGRLHTANPGEKNLLCEITNVGMVGVKISEVYASLHEPPGRPISLHLPEGEQPRKLDSGDSQTWTSGPMEYGFEYDPSLRATGDWTRVEARDTAGNRYTVRNPDFVPPPPYTG